MGIWNDMGMVYALLGAAVAVFQDLRSELVLQDRQRPEL